MYYHKPHSCAQDAPISRVTETADYDTAWESLKRAPHIFIPDEGKSDVEMINFIVDAFGLYKRPYEVLYSLTSLWVAYEGVNDAEGETVWHKVEQVKMKDFLPFVLIVLGTNSAYVAQIIKGKNIDVSCQIIDDEWHYHVAFGEVLSVNIHASRNKLVISSVEYLRDETNPENALWEEDIVRVWTPGYDLTQFVA